MLLLSGIFLSLLLLLLRLSSQFGLSDDLRMFSGAFGYEGQKKYAVFLLNQKNEPLLFVFTVREGAIEFKTVTIGSSLLTGFRKSNLPKAARELLEKERAFEDVDAIGFITSGAAGKMVDAFGGFYIDDMLVSSSNLDMLWERGRLENSFDFNESVFFSKRKLVTRSASILSTIREIFSKRLVAVYFKNAEIYGKPCFGACETQLFEYFTSDVTLTR